MNGSAAATRERVKLRLAVLRETVCTGGSLASSECSPNRLRPTRSTSCSGTGTKSVARLENVRQSAVAAAMSS